MTSSILYVLMIYLSDKNLTRDIQWQRSSKVRQMFKNLSDKVETAVAGRNPMFDLFYGRVRIEGKNHGLEFSREEQCGQWPQGMDTFVLP